MSSNCPPQLQLSIQPNTNNFKRSFEQFGVDLGSPVGSADAGGSGNNGNDRNKRARSSSSFSESSESAGSSTIVSGSNSSSSSMSMSREDRVGNSSGRPIIVLDPGVPLVPPRIPTPVIEDIDMADYVEESRGSPRTVPAASPTAQEQHRTPAADSYRLSLERFNAFESEMSLLRRSYPPEPLSRPPTPPPTLPPISISTSPSRTITSNAQRPMIPFPDNVFGSTSTTILDSSSLSDDPTREEQSTEEGPESTFHNTPFRFLPLSSSHELPRGAAAESQPERNYQMQNGFRVHLDSALERLRSSSPLALSVGVGVAQPEPEEEQYEAEEEEEIVAEMLSRTAGPEPPTLPPIPSVATATEGEDWNDRVPFLNNEDDETSGATANAASPSTTNPWIARWQNPFPTPTRRAPSATTHPSLRDHPLPSPILRDLHSWMEEREITGTPPTSLWMSSADAAMSTHGVSESRDDANRNSLEDGNTGLTSHNLGPSVSDGRWDARHPQPVLFATSGSSSIAPSVIRNMRRTYTNSNGTFSEPVGSWVSEDTPSYLFANPTSLSFARNTADQETLRSLDHGNPLRLGFGPRVLPRMNMSDSNPLNGRATSHSTTPSSRHSQTAANSNAEDASRRVNLSPAVSNLSDNNVTSSRRFSLPRLSAQDIDRPWYGGLVPQFNLHQPTFQHAAPFNDGSSEAQHDSATTASPALSLRQDARHQERTNDNHSHPSTFQYAVPYDDGSSEAQRGAAALSAPASRQDAPRQERADRSTRSSTFQYAVPFNDGSREAERGRPVSPVSTSRQDASSRQERANSDVRSSDPPSTVLPWETVPLDTMDGIDDPHPMIWYRSEYGIGLPPRRRSLHGQSRLGTSTSLVAENAAEARRQADYANVQRAREMSHERTPADTFNSILAGNTTPRSSQDEQDTARMRSSTTGRWQADELGWPHRRNPYIFPFERRRNPSPDSPSAEMESATSSAVEPPMMGIGSGVYPRRPAHRQDDRPHLPLDTSAISDMPELNSPNEAAALRSFLRRELEALERSSLSSSAHANWNRMHGEPAHSANTPQRSRPPSPRSRESVADRLRSRIESLTDSSIPMEGVVETSPLETRGNTNAAASTNRDRNNEPFRYLDVNPRNTQTRPSVAPSLPSPDLGASFDAVRQAHIAFLRRLIHDDISQGGIENRERPPSQSHQGYTGIFSRIEEERRRRLSQDVPRHDESRVSEAEMVSRARRMLPENATASERYAAYRFQRSLPFEGRESRDRTSTAAGHNATTPASPGVIDVDMFRPGPFRNTVQHHYNERRRQQMSSGRTEPSIPPTIPPLPFEQNSTTNMDASPIRDGPPRPELPRSNVGRETTSPNVPLPRPHYSFASARAAAMNESSRRRTNPDIHNLLTRQARSEASRIEDPTTPSTQTNSDRRPRVDPIQPDGFNLTRNQQLQYQRAREQLHARGLSNPVNDPHLVSNAINIADYILSDEFDSANFRPGLSLNETLRQNEESARESAAAPAHAARARRGRYGRSNLEAFALARGARRPRSYGDFILDEEFDDSYENLISLSQWLGDAKPKSTPSDILEKMEKAQYKDWATDDSDKRCPICLDDYGQTDKVLKLTNCSHWLHQDCLQRWLQTSNTCPVCRKSVVNNNSSSSTHSTTSPRGIPMRYQVRFVGVNRRPSQTSRRPPRPESPTGTNPNNNEGSRPAGDRRGEPPSGAAPWRRMP